MENDYSVLDSPELFIVDTTDICNLKCKMCHQNSSDFIIRDEPHISLELIKKLTEVAKNSKTIYLIGQGEPLMHPDIYEIIKTFKDNCPQSLVATTSNGVLLNEKNIAKLIASKLDSISISLDGPNLERGHQKSEKTYKNLIKLNEVKKKLGISYPQIVIGIVLGKDNEKELLPIIEYAKSIDAQSVTVEPLRIIAPQEDWDDYIIANDPFKHKKSIKPILEKAKNLARKLGIGLNAPYFSQI
jgi:MoaA/NifB/PqqE/SkfB family radical SAM enzyme